MAAVAVGTRMSEGVEWVVHIVGPNMSPQRPECLEGDRHAALACRATALWFDLVPGEELLQPAEADLGVSI